MPSAVIKDILSVGNILNDKEQSLKERFRALFTLRNIGGPIAINEITKCFDDSSALLKHELAYCLGQMQDILAIPKLVEVLKDKSQEPMVRHEAGEALGAIGDISVVPILEEFSLDPVVEVSETCQLALKRINWENNCNDKTNLIQPYMSVDPAPPADCNDVEELTKILLDENRPLFERYKAMFSLRNLNTEASVLALAKGLKAGSALFRHEVAFVLGQLQEPISIPYLIESLENASENEMVRHESAEALGAIATPECLAILKRYLNDETKVVRESCVVALDMGEYENGTEFQYANTLINMSS